jgi:peptidoglycan/xylan/chitin deacetylase (PgdA/CDA1 family)
MTAIFTYHAIDTSRSPIATTPAVFARHLEWLTSGRVPVRSLDEVAADPKGDAVAVTFDDGLASARPAIDALLDRGLVPTLFVVTGHVGRTNAWQGRDARGVPTQPLLDWDALGGLLQRGARIEAHTRTHPWLTRVSDAQLDDELEGCRDDLLVRLGVESAHVAYPFGDVDDRVAARARRVFSFGYTDEMRLRDQAPSVMRLPRLDMYYYRTPKTLESWGRARFARRVDWIRARRALRARVWR